MIHQSTAQFVSTESAGLREILLSAGIRPWSEEGIRAYRVQEAAKYPGNFWHYFEPVFLATTVLLPLGLGAIAAASLFVLGLDLIGYLLAPHWHIWTTIAIWSSAVMVGAVLLIVMAGISIYLAETNIEVVEPAQWDRVSLEDYNGLVPKDAYLLIRRTRQLLPGAVFSIDELTQGTHMLDPILWVKVKTWDGTSTESAAILVWDQNNIVVLPR